MSQVEFNPFVYHWIILPRQTLVYGKDVIL